MFTDHCVYTIVSGDRLRPAALEQSVFVSREASTWRKARALLEEGRKAGRSMPLLLADAKDCSRLLYWGVLKSVDIRGAKTEYSVDRLRATPGRHAPQELILLSTGKPIAPGFIRPYAICYTPDFLTTSSPEPVLGPWEGPSQDTFIEGGVMQVLVNAYERNPAARAACIEHYGCKCTACGFDFASAYGELGLGFIEVHHLEPLSRLNGEHAVDPIQDLRPLCPNCHAMLHRRKPPLRVDQLQALLGPCQNNLIRLS